MIFAPNNYRLVNAPDSSRPTPSGESASAQSLCLACGLCCNGVLFKDVELRDGDDGTKLESLGLALERLKRKVRFPQPCSALCGDNRCRIYADRPVRCREFECALLKGVGAGRVTQEQAFRIIRVARQRSEKVRRFLGELGDKDEELPLSVRFRRTRRRVESGTIDEDTADAYAKLSLAVHDLNLLLRDAFYPGEA
jgi:Fe-S-cluster containining protein